MRTEYKLRIETPINSHAAESLVDEVGELLEEAINEDNNGMYQEVGLLLDNLAEVLEALNKEYNSLERKRR